MTSLSLRRALAFGAFAGLAAAVSAGTPAARPSKTDAGQFFTREIAPVLASACADCHGPKKQRGGLRLDSRDALLKGGGRGPAVVPGEPDKSILIKALRHADDDLQMPPKKQLPAAVVDAFAAWVRDGAVWPVGARVTQQAAPEETRWAFTPARKVEPPADPSGWSAGVVDRFVRAKLRERGLEPAPHTDKRVLLRRVTFDLTGLPPTPAEVDDFLADTSSDAYARVVDRLLASPRYGERWGRHWLDAARYADTSGFEADHFYQGSWRYRDYVIRSLNADKPADRFIQEQVAGDELWPDDPEAVQATALYCIGPALDESAMVPDRLEQDWLTDAADTTGELFLGLTVGCARCHDHKYDPVTQKDYYALQAVFAASDRPYPEKVRTARLKALNGILAEVPLPDRLKDDPRCAVRTEDVTGFHLFPRARPLEVHRLHRGELGKPREVMAPAVPAVLTSAGRPDFAAKPGRRAALARWLTAPDNPLTPRVLVNRVWGWHFGRGLVRTPNDFGAQGELPTHPELLDWLARDFVEHGWCLKRLHRQIVLSSTYRMSAVARGPGARDDPEDRLLRHFPRRRLEGEAVRDAMLACAGTLNPKPFGPPVVPPLSKEELTGLFGKDKWPVTKDATEHTRRSVYLLVRRTFLYPLLASFDPPEVMTSCPRRRQTVVPTQALALLNSPLAREQALAFARRLRKVAPGDVPRQTADAWRLAFGRPITPAEAKHAAAFLRGRTVTFALTGAADPAGAALSELCLALFNANEFVYLD
jgi:hypothetical protein